MITTKSRLLVNLLALGMCLCTGLVAGTDKLDVDSVVERMTRAYEMVTDYQADLDVKTHDPDGSFDEKRALYSFKKPNWIRIDFKLPYSDMVLVYPHDDGKVLIRPGGLLRFLKIPLSPSNSLLEVAPGQRIDQTDLGLLIQSISYSVRMRRHGEVHVSDEVGRVAIRVEAENHFRPGVTTLYTFFIDKRLWLPVFVEEETPQGVLERTVAFGDLRVNVGLTERFFRLN